MVKIIIANWRLRELAEAHPEIYDNLHAADKSLPERAKVKDGHSEYSAYVQDVSMLPQEILDIAKWEACPPLKVLFASGTHAHGIKEAIGSSQVHLPGNELLRIHSVRVVEDYCTDQLQCELDDGWKIVAVCVRTSQRIPDYVLGRFNSV